MNPRNLFITLMALTYTALGDGLPVISSNTQNQIVVPGYTGPIFSVVSSNATGFQWRFNGTDISGATNATLQITNAQSANVGYYMAVAKNPSGWVPSQMAWLSVVSGSGGVVPFSNKTNNYWDSQVLDHNGVPLNGGTAQVVAGPALDQMQPFGLSFPVSNGYYGFSFVTRSIPTVAVGQTVYYRVDTSSAPWHTQSRVMSLTAGPPTPSVDGLSFPPFWAVEAPEPALEPYYSATNQVRIPGETFSLTNAYFCYVDYGIPTAQWRKNGSPILGATNFTIPFPDPGDPNEGPYQGILTITNIQPADAGIYDLVVIGNNWIVGPKTTVSIQLTNAGAFLSPRISGTGFVTDLQGVAGRNYSIQWSSNLTSWSSFMTLSNTTGQVSFTNSPSSTGTRFYRAMLLP